MGMLRLSASRRAEGKPALPTQQPYTTVNVEPNLIGTKRRRPYERQLYKLLVLLGKGAVGLILLCPVVFLLTWNHLFAIDVGSSVTETAGKLMSPKTFTVRWDFEIEYIDTLSLFPRTAAATRTNEYQK